VGKSPGEKDGELGIPFSFGSGTKCAELLAKIGLSWEKDCYITNPVFCAANGDPTPSVREIIACGFYFDRLVELCRPKSFFALGSTALRALVGKSFEMARVAGHTDPIPSRFRADGKPVPVWCIYHPAYFFKPKVNTERAQSLAMATLNAFREATFLAQP
jgi:DNA polymerase